MFSLYVDGITERGFMKRQKNQITVEYVKQLGKERSNESLLELFKLHSEKSQFSAEVKREIISSIGRSKDNDKVYDFMSVNAFAEDVTMDEVYQCFRTALYKKDDIRFQELANKILKKYDNEVLERMLIYRNFNKKSITKNLIEKLEVPLILDGDNVQSLRTLPEKSVQLIFTSPPYYNAREYSTYKSYKDYLEEMYLALEECYRVLEDGRFIIYNVSPVITKRPGREFSSHRYPIHFDFHNIMVRAGFTFVDEIIWIKPEASVTNRNGGIQQTRSPLMYKPNTITESILVYRKDVGFLLDENIKKQGKFNKIQEQFELDTSNCWYIHPSSNPNHPAVFPEKLCEKIITYYSFENDVVLDHYAGSGTFGRVALRMNRRPILCEKNEAYLAELRKIK